MRLARITLALTLAALPTLAQDRWSLALALDQQNPKAQNLGDATDTTTLSPAKGTGFGLALAYRAGSIGSADLEVMASYRFKGKADLRVTTVWPGHYSSEVTADYTTSYVGLGAQAVWHLPIDLGVGLQWRFEKLAAEPRAAGNSWNANLNRPWLNLSVGHTFKGQGSIHPFVSAGVAVPLTQVSAPRDPANSDAEAASNREKIIQSMASRSELSLQAGIRF